MQLRTMNCNNLLLLWHHCLILSNKAATDLSNATQQYIVIDSYFAHVVL